MYESLVKSLRDCADDSCENCAYLKQDEESCFVKFCGILQEAADAIEELSKDNLLYEIQLSKMSLDLTYAKEALPRWISVEERLPELGEEVLVYFHWVNPPEKGSIARDSMHIHDISMKPVWKKHIGGKVTHWMPLPEPPKEET